MQPYPPKDPNYTPADFVRVTKPYLPGMCIFAVYLAALVYYLYIRARFTMDMAGWAMVYAVAVYATEIGGASAMIAYGFTLC